MTKEKLNKKIVLITGGSRGIGLAIAKKFSSNGSKVYFTYLNSKKNYFKKNNIFKDKNLIPIKCDMRNLNQINKLGKILHKEKKIDVLVNNVGDVVRRSSFHRSNDKLWRETLDINLMATVRTTKSVLKLLLKAANPVVVNISSIASRAGGMGDSLHYGVAKAAINIFTSGLAREFKKFKFGIRVVGVAPSIVDTDFQKRHSSKKRLKNIIKLTPMKRIASPDEISEIVYFASSQKAAYLSGDTIFVTGGR